MATDWFSLPASFRRIRRRRNGSVAGTGSSCCVRGSPTDLASALSLLQIVGQVQTIRNSVGVSRTSSPWSRTSKVSWSTVRAPTTATSGAEDSIALLETVRSCGGWPRGWREGCAGSATELIAWSAPQSSAAARPLTLRPESTTRIWRRPALPAGESPRHRRGAAVGRQPPRGWAASPRQSSAPRRRMPAPSWESPSRRARRSPSRRPQSRPKARPPLETGPCSNPPAFRRARPGWCASGRPGPRGSAFAAMRCVAFDAPSQ